MASTERTEQNGAPSNAPAVPADRNRSGVDRRSWLAGAGGAAVAWAAMTRDGQAAESNPSGSPALSASIGRVKKGNINSSACRWCFDPVQLPALAEASAAMGIKSVELLKPFEFDIVKKNGLVCAITSSHGFVKGLNRVENHPECLATLRTAIEATGDAGFPNVITFSGMREGLSDEEGIRNTVTGIKQVIGLAEKKKVNLCIEVLNSRVTTTMKGHPDYQCDKVDWAAEVCRQVASPRMKILFDIYHVQIMEGDIITRIRQYKDLIGHYHTAGNPGRNDLDDTQEINYPPIMRAILETGYTGFVGQEYIPKGPDKLAALWKGVELCDV